MKKLIVAVMLISLLVIGQPGTSLVRAAEYKTTYFNSEPLYQATASDDSPLEIIDPALISINNDWSLTRATSRIQWTVPALGSMKLGTRYQLEADDIVTINCTYSPMTADIQFGLIAPNGTFYSTSGSDGNINKAIRVADTGSYYFAVHNNTDKPVEILGYVYY